MSDKDTGLECDEEDDDDEGDDGDVRTTFREIFREIDKLRDKGKLNRGARIGWTEKLNKESTERIQVLEVDVSELQEEIKIQKESSEEQKREMQELIENYVKTVEGKDKVIRGGRRDMEREDRPSG